MRGAMKDDLLDGIPDETPSVAAIVETKPAEMVKHHDAIREIEDRVLTKALRVVEDGLAWADIELGSAEIPEDWIKECGSKEAALRRLRAAHAAQMGPKEAPVGLKLAKEVFVGVVKARATEKAAPRALHIQVGRIDFQLPDFPRLKVDK